MFAVLQKLHLFNINYSCCRKADGFVTRNAIIIIILFVFFLIPACYQKDLWENNYSIPDVTITSANATASTITFNWTYPSITDMKALYITCTDTTTGIVVHTDSVGQQSIISHTINSGLIASQRYNINMRITDKWGKSSPGSNFAIITQAGNIHFIYSTDDLNAVRGGIYAGWNTGDTYNLMEDLDLSDPDYYNAGLGWEPISTFTGIFEGNGYIIRNLMINRGATNRVGLFGLVETGGIIRNVNLVNINVQGNQYVGGLIAYCQNSGPVSGCSVTGTIKGSADSVGGLIAYNLNCNVSSSYTNVTIEGAGSYIGGLIGICYATQITSCYSICSVKATGISTYGIGGLVGNSEGTITGSYARGTITATASGIFSVGGLVGNGSSTMISNSYAEANISNAWNWTGGLVGYIRNNATVTIVIDNCHATGSVNSNSYSIGGLIGYLYNSSTGQIILQNNCYATGTVNSTSNSTGGLIGQINNDNTGSISLTDCYASGAVSGTTNIGGLIGYNNNASTGSITLTRCNKIGTLSTIDGTSYIGGLIGYSNSPLTGLITLNNCNSTGLITATGNNSYAGGLIGYNNNTFINTCTSSGVVTATGADSYAGGLIGRNVDSMGSNDLAFSSSSCAVNGCSHFTGGLIGYNDSAKIKDSHATGNVTVTITTATGFNTHTGGLIGYLAGASGTVIDSSYSGTVMATITANNTFAYTGGLIGYVGSVPATSIDRSHAIGTVTTTINGSPSIIIYSGGLIGQNNGALTSQCYFNGEVHAISSTASDSYAGGLIGRLEAGSIIYSFSNGIVRANTSANKGTGGLVGYNNNCTISNSYSLCSVEAAGTFTGGFIGYHVTAVIAYCYSAGLVSGISSNKGGFCGWNNGGTITSCYYDQDISGQNDNTGKGMPITPSDLMKYPNDIFANPAVWAIDPIRNNRYPYLISNWPY